MLLASPIDFTPEDPGFFGLWTVLTGDRYFDPNLLFDPDAAVEAFGNIPADLPGRLVEAGTSVLDPLGDYTATYAKSLWERIGGGKSANSVLAVSKWVDDGVPFPGEAFRRWIRDFYRQAEQAPQREARTARSAGGAHEHHLPRPEHRGREGLYLSRLLGKAYDGPRRE